MVLLGVAGLLLAVVAFGSRIAPLAQSTAPTAEPVALRPDRLAPGVPSTGSGALQEDTPTTSSQKPPPSILPELALPQKDVPATPPPAKEPDPPRKQPDRPRKEEMEESPAKPPKLPREVEEPRVVRREPVPEDTGPPEDAPPAKDRPFLVLDASGHVFMSVLQTTRPLAPDYQVGSRVAVFMLFLPGARHGPPGSDNRFDRIPGRSTDPSRFVIAFRSLLTSSSPVGRSDRLWADSILLLRRP
jgi:hypothetical protein